MIRFVWLLALASGVAAQSRPTTKGIWEPVNYSQDLKLNDAFFVTPDVGWVAGDAGTILHTRDGGANWTAQLGGDSQSEDRPITSLRFLDAQHGWATQGNDLLRTTDGENWHRVGAFQYEWRDFVFTTFETGIYVRKDQIHRTTDGGRTWKQVHACRVQIAVQGLARNVGCAITSVHFPSAAVGYAVSSYVGEKSQFVLLKTTDGGESWQAAVVTDVPLQYHNKVFFFDETQGLIAVDGGAVHVTRDGGRTWTGVVGSVGYDFRFADPEVGWSVTRPNMMRQSLAFTTDGGRRWASRPLTFPATVLGVSVPRRDRAYVVGDHGMVYRYRVVAAAEPTAAGVLSAPVMPVFESPLDDAVESVDEEVDQLEQQLDSVTETSGTDSSAFVDTCCRQSMQELQSAVDALTPQVPAFLAKYRNVNLIVAGLQIVGVLPDQLGRVKAALQQLRGARGAAAGAAALTELNAAVDQLSATTRQAFQKDPLSTLAQTQEAP